MTELQAFILGLIQGLAEFLPISSSGHLTLGQMFFGLSDVPMTLDILLHLGTLLAVFVVYWKRIWNMIVHPIASELKYLILATIPAVLAALFLGDFIDRLFEGAYLGFSFLLTSFVLVLGEAVNRLRPRTSKHKQVNAVDAIVMGCMQAVAIAPGLSRSGSTICGGMFSGLSRKRAADFSFLMSIPAILGSAVLDLKDMYDEASAIGISFGTQFIERIVEMGGAIPVIIAVATAAISGFLAIKLMLKIVKKVGMRWFAVYTFLLGAFMIAYQMFFAA
ncbi:MAG: undecaprenyl-diphosphate phosphatase [Clostridia bacterium]|nr:undecaprenyl-diphosphate phosphatase [Clostridia bacterium]